VWIYAYAYANSYSHCDTDANANGYSFTDSNGNSEAYAYATESAHTTASSDARSALDRRLTNVTSIGNSRANLASSQRPQSNCAACNSVHRKGPAMLL